MLEPFSGLDHNPNASSADWAQADPRARASAIRAAVATSDSLRMGAPPPFASPVARARTLGRLPNHSDETAAPAGQRLAQARRAMRMRPPVPRAKPQAGQSRPQAG